MNLPSPDLNYSRSSEARVSVEERRGRGRKDSIQPQVSLWLPCATSLLENPPSFKKTYGSSKLLYAWE